MLYRSIAAACRFVLLVAVLQAMPGCGLNAADVSFHRQVIPLLTRAGCNAGACHGAAAGRGGLHLSLFGSNPQDDYQSLVHQLEGRRIHRLAPEKSLLLRKPLGELSHGGDQVFDADSLEYKTLVAWIRQGAVLDRPAPITELRVSIEPQGNASDPRYRLAAFATFTSDPAPIEVTTFTQFTVADPDALELSLNPDQLRVLRPGRHVVIARFLDRIQATTITRAYPARDMRILAASNFIDREIHATLNELQLPFGHPISDAEYLRRVSLDLIGRLPQLDEVHAFLADENVDKRQRLVDRLLSSPAFNDYWTLVFAGWLRLHSLPNDTRSAEAYGRWIHQAIADGSSWSDMTRQLLTTQGDSHESGPANFSRMVGDARAHAEMVSEVFLGARMGCANCHDHPLDRWTQDDYHGLAAMLARIDRGRHVRFTSRGDVTHPKTTLPARWRLPGDRFVEEVEQPLEVLAQWLTRPDHNRLSIAFTNRVWSEVFGRGLVEAVDDLRVTNPATHPELLAELSQQVVRHNYDLRCLLRWMVTSQSYARQSADQVDQYYGFYSSKRLSAHVLADAIADVTGVPLRTETMPAGTRAVQLLDPLAPSPALDVLGRCNRVAACTPSLNATGLATQLHLINGELINRRLDDPNGRLARMLDNHSTEQIVYEFTMRSFTQPLNDKQIDDWVSKLHSDNAQERRQRLQDWLWSILSSDRFQRNQSSGP